MTSAKAFCAVLGCATIYFAMGLYFSFGSNAVYMISYLRLNSSSKSNHEQSIWFFAAVGFSALLLPVGGMLHRCIGLRATCTLAGLLQTFGILITYYTLDHSFWLVIFSYGGSFLFSCGLAYTPPLVNCTLWLPTKKGLATGFVCAAMALAPLLWNPILTHFINPHNVRVSDDGYFYDALVLKNTKDSMLLQGCITFCLYAMGVLLLFPAPNSEPKFKQIKKALAKQESKKSPDVRDESIELQKDPIVGLSPRRAVKTFEFWLLSFKIMITELIFYYLLFVYKPFGQTFIANDFFLSSIGASSALANTACRLGVGQLKDMFSYKNCCIPLSGLAVLLIAALPFTNHLPPIVYAILMVSAIGIVGSQYALMPSAVGEAFGERYASINIGLVYMSTVIADIIGGLGSHYLTQHLGWKGMLQIIAVCALIDFLVSFWLPSDQTNRLNQRLLHRNFECIDKMNRSSSTGHNPRHSGTLVQVMTADGCSMVAVQESLVLHRPTLRLIGCPNCSCANCQSAAVQRLQPFCLEVTRM